jgi:hypothetical protein
MKKALVIILALLMLSTGFAIADNTHPQKEGSGELSTDKKSYNLGETVVFTFENTGQELIRTRPVLITYWIEKANGPIVRDQYCYMPITPLVYWQPGESYSWTWDQTSLNKVWKGSQCFEVSGPQVPRGRYTASLEWWYDFGVPGGGIAEASFTIKGQAPPTEDFPPGQGEEHASDQGQEHGQAFEDGWVPPGQAKKKGIPFETIDKGYVSHYNYGDPNFNGEYKVIRDQESWEDFWDTHTSGIYPQPDVPEINFKSRMVLVALQGYRTDCCNYYIEFTKITQKGGTMNAYVYKNEESGMFTLITNPFHIIETKKAKNVNFIEV